MQGSPDYYRERAADMLKRAEAAESEEARSTFLALAASWDRMAQILERPNW